MYTASCACKYQMRTYMTNDQAMSDADVDQTRELCISKPAVCRTAHGTVLIMQGHCALLHN